VSLSRSLQAYYATTMTETPRSDEVTTLLMEWRRGDAVALQRLLPLVYADLRKVARAHLRREQAGHSLQATALVHEVYLRLVGADRLRVESRTHFMAVAVRLMRQILVDHFRRKRASKRGGAVTVVGLDMVPSGAEPSVGGNEVDVLALDRALEELASFDPQQCRLVELKFFAGLTIEEMAEALGISTATVEREWVIARAWLYQRLTGPIV
jgi:RNA polymerase sigma-70 factor, ECF subfamily